MSLHKNIDLDISKSVLRRLSSFYKYQYELNDLLNRAVTPPAADFFTETVMFYLKVYFKIKGISYDIESEVAIQRKRGSIRPDISIWNGDQIIAIIECKTQLGWSRNSWESQFMDRENKLNEIYPDAKAFLLVMTTVNWNEGNGFSEKFLRGKKYFALSNRWPSEIDFINEDYIVDRLEELLLQI